VRAVLNVNHRNRTHHIPNHHQGSPGRFKAFTNGKLMKEIAGPDETAYDRPLRVPDAEPDPRHLALE